MPRSGARQPATNKEQSDSRILTDRSTIPRGSSERSTTTGSSRAEALRQKLSRRRDETRAQGTGASQDRSSSQGSFQPDGIVGDVEAPRENWSTADQILERARQRQPRGESPFSSEEMANARESRSGIFPGERQPQSDDRPGTNLSEILASRSQRRGNPSGSSETSESENVASEGNSPEASNPSAEGSGSNSSNNGGDYLPKPDETGSNSNNNSPAGFLGDLADQVQDGLNNAGEAVGDAVEQGSSNLEDLAESLGEAANDAAEAVGEQAQQTGDYVQGQAEALPGRAGQARDRVIDTAYDGAAEVLGEERIDQALEVGQQVLNTTPEDLADTASKIPGRLGEKLLHETGKVIGEERVEAGRDAFEEALQTRPEDLAETAGQIPGRLGEKLLHETGKVIGEERVEAGRDAFEEALQTRPEDLKEMAEDTAENVIRLGRDQAERAREAAQQAAEDLLDAVGPPQLPDSLPGKTDDPRDSDPTIEHRPERSPDRRGDREGRPGSIGSDSEERGTEGSRTSPDRDTVEPDTQTDEGPSNSSPPPADEPASGHGDSDVDSETSTPPADSDNETTTEDTSAPSEEMVEDEFEDDESNETDAGSGLLDLLDRLDPLINSGDAGGFPGSGFETFPTDPGFDPGMDFDDPAIADLDLDSVPEDALDETPRIRTDIEVVDVRFLDLGDASADEGPRFRVWLRNHNNKFELNDVEVALMAGIDLADETLPQSTVTGFIETIEASGTAQIDIRLSRDSLALQTDADDPARPFSQLAVVADPTEQFDDVDPDNNVLLVGVDDVQHADLTLLSANESDLTSGQSVVLSGEGFQFNEGAVALVVNEKPYVATVQSWTPTEIEIQLPRFRLTRAVAAQLTVVRPDREITLPLEVRLVPESP